MFYIRLKLKLNSSALPSCTNLNFNSGLCRVELAFAWLVCRLKCLLRVSDLTVILRKCYFKRKLNTDTVSVTCALTSLYKYFDIFLQLDNKWDALLFSLHLGSCVQRYVLKFLTASY